MTVSRRGFFGMLAGLAAAPLFTMFPKEDWRKGWVPAPGPNKYAYRFYYVNSKTGAKMEIPSVVRHPEPRYFRCGTGEMGTLYWSKEVSE